MKYACIDYEHVVAAKNALQIMINEREYDFEDEKCGFPQLAWIAKVSNDTLISAIWVVVQTAGAVEDRGSLWQFYMPRTADVMDYIRSHEDEEIDYSFLIDSIESKYVGLDLDGEDIFEDEKIFIDDLSLWYEEAMGWA